MKVSGNTVWKEIYFELVADLYKTEETCKTQINSTVNLLKYGWLDSQVYRKLFNGLVKSPTKSKERNLIDRAELGKSFSFSVYVEKKILHGRIK